MLVCADLTVLGARMIDDRWVSVDEIRDYLGVTRDTIYKWIAEKKMPAHRIGRLWKFKKDQVDEWVETGGAGMTRADHQK
jgi:excisionase family DNA binding protein